MKQFRLAILLLLAIAPAGFAQTVTYFTNFDNQTDFPPGQSVSSYTTAQLPANNPNQDLDWVTSDANQRDDILASSNNAYSGYSGDSWGAMGGELGNPSQAEVELYNPVKIGSAFTMSMEFVVTSSTAASGNPINDTFGLTFRNTSNNLLFQILFTPDAGSPNSLLDVVWNDGGSNSSQQLQIDRNAAYNIQVTGNLAAATFQSTVSVASNPSSQGSFSGSMASTGQTLSAAALTWQTATASAPGNNLLLFNNYSVIPEPSALISFLLGGATLVLWRPRRKRFI